MIDIDPATNTIVVGDNQDLLTERMLVKNLTWIEEKTDRSRFKADVKSRYNRPGAAATIIPTNENSAEITFDKPERAPTPGQAAVFYHDDVLLGGGWIEKQQR